MNKFLMAISISFLLIGALGCSKESLDLDFSKEFSEKQIIHALEENFSKLHNMTNYPGEKEIINGVAPSIYQMEGDQGYLYIYVFDTLADRKKAGSWNSFFGYEYEANKKRIFAANNVLFLYQWTDDQPENFQKADQLGNFILKNLNPYEKHLYFGQSDHWIGYYTIDSYHYSYQDKNGTYVYDGYSESNGRVRYKDWHPGDPFTMSYTINLGDHILEGSGKLTLTGSEVTFKSKSGSLNPSDIQIDLRWKDQQETLLLNKNEVEVREETDNDVPDTVKEMAYDHVIMSIDNYNRFDGETVLDAKITGLTKINTGTASEFIDIQMWLLEYRILSESDTPLLLAGGMTLDDGWRTEYSSAGQPIIVVVRYHDFPVWQKIGITNTLTITEEYNDDYSEAAVRMYEKYSLHQ